MTKQEIITELKKQRRDARDEARKLMKGGAKLAGCDKLPETQLAYWVGKIWGLDEAILKIK
jgi:hypothetical protein